MSGRRNGDQRLCVYGTWIGKDTTPTFLKFWVLRPVTIQMQSFALRALRKRKPQETKALAFLAVFVYATHATQATAFEWKPGFTLDICRWHTNMTLWILLSSWHSGSSLSSGWVSSVIVDEVHQIVFNWILQKHKLSGAPQLVNSTLYPEWSSLCLIWPCHAWEVRSWLRYIHWLWHTQLKFIRNGSSKAEYKNYSY